MKTRRENPLLQQYSLVLFFFCISPFTYPLHVKHTGSGTFTFSPPSTPDLYVWNGSSF